MHTSFMPYLRYGLLTFCICCGSLKLMFDLYSFTFAALKTEDFPLLGLAVALNILAIIVLCVVILHILRGIRK